MACVQIIEMHIKDSEQLQGLGGQFCAGTEDKRFFVTLHRNDLTAPGPWGRSTVTSLP
jgi:hypothetical protein